jgi:hypothetical protein
MSPERMSYGYGVLGEVSAVGGGVLAATAEASVVVVVVVAAE